MKALLKSTLVIAAAAVAFASCQTEEINAPAEGKTVNFLAVSNDAKAAFSTPDGTTYPVLWTANDKDAKVSLNLADVKDATVTPADDFASATISCSAITDDNKGSYTFYAISPAKAWIGTSTAKKSFNLSIPAAQTPTATSVDEATMVLFGQTETLTEFPTDYVPMTFKHVAAYGLLSFANLNLDGATVTSVEISSSEDIAGRWNYFPEEDNVSVNSGVNAITITTASAEGIWFAIAPVDLTGKYVKFTVNTSKGTFTREFQAFTKGNFEAGKIAKFAVDMSGIAPVEGEKYILVKDASSLAVGDKVIIGAQAFDYAISTTQNTSNRAAAAVEKDEDGNIITAGSSVEIFTLVAGKDVDGSFGFMTSDGKYIYAAGATSSNKLGTTTTLNATASWTVSIDDKGIATIKCANASVTRNTLQFNNGSTSNLLFSCYSSASQKAVAIYKSNAVVPSSEPVQFELTAAMVTSNFPMEYVTQGQNPDEYGFGSGEWHNPITSAQTAARKAKYGLPENMWDNDPETSYHTNLDWGQASTSWTARSPYGWDYCIDNHYIQITLPHSAKTIDLKIKQSSDKCYDREGIGVSLWAASYDGNFVKVDDYSWGKTGGVELDIEGVAPGFDITTIRLKNNNYSDWTGCETSLGIAELEIWDMNPAAINQSKVGAFFLSNSAVNAMIGTPVTITATVLPETAVNKSVSWRSSNTAVATVADGVITPIAAGSAVITATTIDGGYTATCDVTVTDLPEITLTADMLSTNAPMTYYSNCNPDWPSNYDASEGREDKYGLAANALDGDIATSYHTNFDCWEYAGEAYGNWGWACRAGFDGNAAKHYITLNLGKTYSNGVKISIVNSDKEALGSGLNVYTSTDASEFSLFTSFDSVAKNEEVKFDVNKEVMAIRFENKAGVDWTGIGNAMGLAEVKAWEL